MNGEHTSLIHICFSRPSAWDDPLAKHAKDPSRWAKLHVIFSSFSVKSLYHNGWVTIPNQKVNSKTWCEIFNLHFNVKHPPNRRWNTTSASKRSNLDARHMINGYSRASSENNARETSRRQAVCGGNKQDDIHEAPRTSQRSRSTTNKQLLVTRLGWPVGAGVATHKHIIQRNI